MESNAFLEILSDINTLHAKVSAIRDGLNRGLGAREMSLCLTSLDEARHWTDDAMSLTLPPELPGKTEVRNETR